jgi:hypothetical protein
VVSAVPWFALTGLFDVVPAPLAEIARSADRMASSPIVTVNLWFDRTVIDEPFVGLPGRAMQWVFDNVRCSAKTRRICRWSPSGAASIVQAANDELIALAHQELLDALPRPEHACAGQPSCAGARNVFAGAGSAMAAGSGHSVQRFL